MIILPQRPHTRYPVWGVTTPSRVNGVKAGKEIRMGNQMRLYLLYEKSVPRRFVLCIILSYRPIKRTIT